MLFLMQKIKSRFATHRLSKTDVTCRHDIILWKRSEKEHPKHAIEAQCWCNINSSIARAVLDYWFKAKLVHIWQAVITAFSELLLKIRNCGLHLRSRYPTLPIWYISTSDLPKMPFPYWLRYSLLYYPVEDSD